MHAYTNQQESHNHPAPESLACVGCSVGRQGAGRQARRRDRQGHGRPAGSSVSPGGRQAGSKMQAAHDELNTDSGGCWLRAALGSMWGQNPHPNKKNSPAHQPWMHMTQQDSHAQKAMRANCQSTDKVSACSAAGVMVDQLLLSCVSPPYTFQKSFSSSSRMCTMLWPS